MNYYNEYDPKAAAWIRQLIELKLIPNGHVDTRSIVEVQPSDLRGFTQCHFFCGIAGWPLALRRAGWPDDRPIWTGSCPCQSFSVAGKGKGTADERHLWPVFARLVEECRPPALCGEQVASKLARTDWLPGVLSDLQRMGYTGTSIDLCCPCAGEDCEGRIVRGDQGAWENLHFGRPHIRQRLYWVAFRGDQRLADPYGGQRHGFAAGQGREPHGDAPGRDESDGVSQPSGGYGGLADPTCRGLAADGGTPGCCGHAQQCEQAGGPNGLADPGAQGLQGGERGGSAGAQGRSCGHAGECGRDGAANGLVNPGGEAATAGSCEPLLIPCRDGKTRRAESRIQPLVAKFSSGVGYSGDPCLPEYANATGEARVMRLSGYGNAINVAVAELFIRCIM